VIATVVRFTIHPSRLRVQAGTPVTWVNIDDPPQQFLVEDTAAETDDLLKGRQEPLYSNNPAFINIEIRSTRGLNPSKELSKLRNFHAPANSLKTARASSN